MIIKVKLTSVGRGQFCTCSMRALLRVKFKDTNSTVVWIELEQKKAMKAYKQRNEKR